MIKIVLDRREHGWAATIVGDPAYWGFGTSMTQAVGDLILGYPGHFDLEIRMPVPPKPSPTNLPKTP
jgi:hypothetical protein